MGTMKITSMDSDGLARDGPEPRAQNPEPRAKLEEYTNILRKGYERQVKAIEEDRNLQVLLDIKKYGRKDRNSKEYK